MIFITTKLIDGEAYAGPNIEADSLDKAKAHLEKFQGCEIAGELDVEVGDPWNSREIEKELSQIDDRLDRIEQKLDQLLNTPSIHAEDRRSPVQAARLNKGNKH